MKNHEIKELLERKRYILSIKDYLNITKDMDKINYLSYIHEGNYFKIVIKDIGEYNFKLKEEQ
ncbi:MAG: hypothetical protein J6J17_01320 [Bacilli bacterium]|nr:hypothetical protein [Bacilli bacterium]